MVQTKEVWTAALLVATYLSLRGRRRKAALRMLYWVAWDSTSF